MISTIAKLSLSAGDALVVTLKHPPTNKQRDDIKAHMSQVLPDGVNVLVLCPDVKLSVVTQAHALA